MGKKPLRRLRRFFGRLLLFLLIVVVAYIAYHFMTYHRLPDTSEQHSSRTDNPVDVDGTYTALTWNLGYGAFNRDFSFFLDGGTEARARSVQHVYDNLIHCLGEVCAQSPDFELFQEVDRKADRSWRLDEAEIIREVIGDAQSYYVQNYNSAYLIYPFKQPYGAAKSGLLTFSNRDIFRAERFSLPVDTGWRKLLDLDRCYSVCHIPTTDGHELCLFNVHLSALPSNEKIASDQLAMLLRNMQDEYEKGNYAVAGGDFNKDLLGRSGEIFGVDNAGFAKAAPIDLSLFTDTLHLVDSLDADHPVPTCRSCKTGYVPGQTPVVVVDGFIVSDNVDVLACRVIDEDFRCSDHNPVVLTFRLRSEAPDPQAGDDTTGATEEGTE